MGNTYALGKKHSLEICKKKSKLTIELKGRKCEFNGIEFNSLSEASIHFNIPRSTLFYKLENEITTIEENNNMIIINGLEFKKISEVCKYYNIPLGTAKYRIENNLEMDRKVSQYYYIIDNVKYNSIREASRETKIPVSTIGNRIKANKKGYSQIEIKNIR